MLDYFVDVEILYACFEFNNSGEHDEFVSTEHDEFMSTEHDEFMSTEHDEFVPTDFSVNGGYIQCRFWNSAAGGRKSFFF